MKTDVWCETVLERAKKEIEAKEACLVLYNRRSDELNPKFGDIDNEVITQLEADSRRAIYEKEIRHEEVDGGTYHLIPISTRVGCIGVLIFQTTPGAEELHMQGPDETTAREAASIVGKVMIDDLFDRYGSIGHKNHFEQSAPEMILPYGNHNCIVVFVDLRSLSRLLDSANDRMKVYEMIEEFIGTISNQTRRHYGVVNKYIGAGALLLFNLTVDDNAINQYRNIAALRALCAAAAIQSRFQEIEQEYRDALFETEAGRKVRTVFRDIDIGVGMNAEQPYLYTIGTADRYDYSCFGSAVSLAKSIESVSGRSENRGVEWDKPGYCSILFADSVELQLRNLATSDRLKDEIEIDFVDGPQDVTFDRFANGYDLQTFKRIQIGDPDFEPKLPFSDTTIYHEPRTDSINGNDYDRWEIQIK
jgi:class 3 adenylate cyclase